MTTTRNTLAAARQRLAVAQAAVETLVAARIEARRKARQYGGGVEQIDAAFAPRLESAHAALALAQREASRAPARCAVTHYRALERAGNALDRNVTDDGEDASADAVAASSTPLASFITGDEDVDPDYDGRFDGVLVSD
jgi:hypothetical protein